MDEQINISLAKLQGEYRSVGLFIENAKTYIQLATGGLVLSVTFSQGMSGQTDVSDLLTYWTL